MASPLPSKRLASDIRSLVIDPRKVVHETLDGEAILLQLETGNYYSLTGSAPEIWNLLAEGQSVDDVVVVLCDRYTGEPGAIAEATHALVTELVQEQLLEEGSNGAANGDRDPERPTAAPTVDFEPPKIQKYTDMQDFLLLDPIHEADSSGWPEPRPAGR